MLKLGKTLSSRKAVALLKRQASWDSHSRWAKEEPTRTTLRRRWILTSSSRWFRILREPISHRRTRPTALLTINWYLDQVPLWRMTGSIKATLWIRTSNNSRNLRSRKSRPDKQAMPLSSSMDRKSWIWKWSRIERRTRQTKPVESSSTRMTSCSQKLWIFHNFCRSKHRGWSLEIQRQRIVTSDNPAPPGYTKFDHEKIRPDRSTTPTPHMHLKTLTNGKSPVSAIPLGPLRTNPNSTRSTPLRIHTCRTAAQCNS